MGNLCKCVKRQNSDVQYSEYESLLKSCEQNRENKKKKKKKKKKKRFSSSRRSQEDSEDSSDGVMFVQHDVIESQETSKSSESDVTTREEDEKTEEEINSYLYKVGKKLGEGAYGAVRDGTRVCDGYKVALKYVDKSEGVEYVSIPSYPEPLPQEIALHLLASDGYDPEILKLLDWQDNPDYYVMVMESFSPCMDAFDFCLSDPEHEFDEEEAKAIMYQACKAAYLCCKRGVFHSDIKLENFLIRTDTRQVKMIDFGCSDFLKETAYEDIKGTEGYIAPECLKTEKYYALPSTVYSLGVMLFVMVDQSYPDSIDIELINKNQWCREHLSEECCSFIQACLQENMTKRIHLQKIMKHIWFQDVQLPDRQQNIIQNPVCEKPKEDFLFEEINSCLYEIGKKLGEGGFGAVYEGTRVCDGFKVAVKYVRKNKRQHYLNIPGYHEALPREIALHILACQGDSSLIIKLLGWQDFENYYVMVLEHFTPCEDVHSFVRRHGCNVSESMSLQIFLQATEAAEECCRQGVFHRDIKLQNLLINPDTMQVKLIDFGCGDLLTTSPYRSYMGTTIYKCPEYSKTGKYHGKPATVFSLGILLFIMVCRRKPDDEDRYQINKKTWHQDGLTTECCSLIQACLQKNPENRMELENILYHKWFQVTLIQ